MTGAFIKSLIRTDGTGATYSIVTIISLLARSPRRLPHAATGRPARPGSPRLIHVDRAVPATTAALSNDDDRDDRLNPACFKSTKKANKRTEAY